MEAAGLAVDAAATLKGIGQDVAQIRELSFKQLEILSRPDEAEEVPQPDEDEAQALILDDGMPDDGGWVTEVHSSVEVPPEFFSDLMAFQWMGLVLSVFMLVALLLNFGATLWLAFSDKWRS